MPRLLLVSGTITANTQRHRADQQRLRLRLPRNLCNRTPFPGCPRGIRSAEPRNPDLLLRNRRISRQKIMEEDSAEQEITANCLKVAAKSWKIAALNRFAALEELVVATSRAGFAAPLRELAGAYLPPDSPPEGSADSEPVRMDGSDANRPEILFKQNPDFSGGGKKGQVILEAVIDEEGCVRSVRPLKELRGRTQPAIDALRKWVFSPGLVAGKPVKVYYVLTITVS